jgi:hypothetical protein
MTGIGGEKKVQVCKYYKERDQWASDTLYGGTVKFPQLQPTPDPSPGLQ